MNEEVYFRNGRPAVLATLNRAHISGRVGGIRKREDDYFVDCLDAKGNIIEEISLDANSYRALKYRWMKCKLLPDE